MVAVPEKLPQQQQAAVRVNTWLTCVVGEFVTRCKSQERSHYSKQGSTFGYINIVVGKQQVSTVFNCFLACTNSLHDVILQGGSLDAREGANIRVHNVLPHHLAPGGVVGQRVIELGRQGPQLGQVEACAEGKEVCE